MFMSSDSKFFLLQPNRSSDYLLTTFFLSIYLHILVLLFRLVSLTFPLSGLLDRWMLSSQLVRPFLLIILLKHTWRLTEFTLRC